MKIGDLVRPVRIADMIKVSLPVNMPNEVETYEQWFPAIFLGEVLWDDNGPICHGFQTPDGGVLKLIPDSIEFEVLTAATEHG